MGSSDAAGSFEPTGTGRSPSPKPREHAAVNLGQGFPDFGWPEDVIDHAAEALRQSNQYPPMPGLPVLREAVAAGDKWHPLRIRRASRLRRRPVGEARLAVGPEPPPGFIRIPLWDYLEG